MCPMCIATTAWVAAGAAGTGGLSILAIRRLRTNTAAKTATTAVFAALIACVLMLAPGAEAATAQDASSESSAAPETAVSADTMQTGYAKVGDGRIYYQVHGYSMGGTVSRSEWRDAHKALLAKEKELTRPRDRLSAERRRSPMVEIDRDYVFESPGKVTLRDLFEGRRQLIVYHFMLEAGEARPCEGCSMVVDNIGHLAHLHARDTSLAIVSPAPIAEIEATSGAWAGRFPGFPWPAMISTPISASP